MKLRNFLKSLSLAPLLACVGLCKLKPVPSYVSRLAKIHEILCEMYPNSSQEEIVRALGAESMEVYAGDENEPWPRIGLVFEDSARATFDVMESGIMLRCYLTDEGLGLPAGKESFRMFCLRNHPRP